MIFLSKEDRTVKLATDAGLLHSSSDQPGWTHPYYPFFAQPACIGLLLLKQKIEGF